MRKAKSGLFHRRFSVYFQLDIFFYLPISIRTYSVYFINTVSSLIATTSRKQLGCEGWENVVIVVCVGPQTFVALFPRNYRTHASQTSGSSRISVELLQLAVKNNLLLLTYPSLRGQSIDTLLPEVGIPWAEGIDG